VGALTQAGKLARGATLIVTLEPCAHQGKQPACTDAIRRAGIRRVVAALADPNPVAAGGAAALRAEGIEVELGLCEAEARAQNAAFLHFVRDSSRPFVALKLATSLDHRIADVTGRSQWISGPVARDYVHWLRAGFDGIAVGARTARADNPALTVRGAVSPRVAPARVVFAPGALLPGALELVRTAQATPTMVVIDPATPEERTEPLEAAGLRLVRAAGLPEALSALRSEGITSLLVEGGGRLAGALLDAGLVDRYHWIQSPVWLGDTAVRATAGITPRSLEDAVRWRPVERRALGDDTLLVVDRERR
jgi:diaminohydroxyphosphoribosylaminopyrimidine deaminase/5-amino-6-(5-phosphoribosylamino)uracil reductase